MSVHPIVRLKTVADVRGGLTKGRDLTGKSTTDVAYLRVANVQDGHLVLDDVATIPATPTDMRQFRLQRGDVLMNEGGDADKLGRGCVWLGELDLCLHQNHVFCVRPSGRILPQWLNYVTSSEPAKFFFLQRSKQTTGIASISSSNLKDLPVPLPPLPTQRAIADFLDRKTAIIDALIDKKERLIALLAEKRAALIHRAVTKGLDPNVPMKDSGVEWIGEIPAHWEVMQVRRFLTAFDQGWSPSSYDRQKESSEWGVLKLSAVRDGAYRPVFHKALPRELEPRPQNCPEIGDLLVSRANTPELVGESCVVDHADSMLMFCDLLYRLKLDGGLASPGFVDLYLRSASGKAFRKTDARGTSHSMVKLSQGHVRAWPVPLPPLDEQRKIVSMMLLADRNYRDLVLALGKSLAGLHEYRQALITAAVTGQLDIPGASE